MDEKTLKKALTAIQELIDNNNLCIFDVDSKSLDCGPFNLSACINGPVIQINLTRDVGDVIQMDDGTLTYSFSKNITEKEANELFIIHDKLTRIECPEGYYEKKEVKE